MSPYLMGSGQRTCLGMGARRGAQACLRGAALPGTLLPGQVVPPLLVFLL